MGAFFCERDGFQTSMDAPEMYSLFTYEALYNLSVETLKVMKKCPLLYVSSENVVKGRRKAVLEVQLASTCNSKERETSTWRSILRTRMGLQACTGFTRTMEFVGLLMVKNLKHCTCCSRLLWCLWIEQPARRVATLRCCFARCFPSFNGGWDGRLVRRYWEMCYREGVNWRAQKRKALTEEMFHAHCKTVLYTLYFHLLDSVVEDLSRSDSLKLLNSSTFRWYSVCIKGAYWSTLQGVGQCIGGDCMSCRRHWTGDVTSASSIEKK